MNRYSNKPISERSAAEMIVAEPRPVLVVDTCNFGNFVGLALSGKSKMIHDILSCLQEGFSRKMFYLVAPQQVYIEFSRPGQFTDVALKELSGPVQHWNAAVQTYNSLCRSPNLLTSGRCFREFDIEEAKQLYDFFVEIGKGFLNQSIKVAASAHTKKWARQRAIERKRPARQGKDSFGDCEICGTALSLLAKLRDSGFAESAYFVSENTEDFACQGELHPDLVPEFDHVSLAYCQTIPQAVGAIHNQHIKSSRGLKP